jgi:hypothetical protein
MFPFLNNINVCKLSDIQIQGLLDALKEAPSFNMKEDSAPTHAQDGNRLEQTSANDNDNGGAKTSK